MRTLLNVFVHGCFTLRCGRICIIVFPPSSQLLNHNEAETLLQSVTSLYFNDFLKYPDSNILSFTP